MTRLVVGGLCAAACATAAFATDFPYDATLTPRYSDESVTVASLDVAQEVTKVGDGMPDSDSIAVVYMNDTLIQALDPEDWESCNETVVNGAQAAFTMVRDENDNLKWKGYATGGWQDLSGVPDCDGTNVDVKIELDYSDKIVKGTARKVRYSIRSASSTGEYTLLSEWLDNAVDAATVVNGVKLYGYAKTGAVEANSGARPAEGSFAVVEDVSANYASIRLDVTPAAGSWGVDKVVVTVKDSLGTIKGATTNQLAEATSGDMIRVDLGNLVQAGESYTYDVQLEGPAGSAGATTSEPVYLYSTDDWFHFTGTGFANATADANIAIADSKFSLFDDEVEGKITPTASQASSNVVVTTTMEIVNPALELTAFSVDDAPQFAVALGLDNGERVWKYCANNVWTSSETSGLPTTNGVYEGRATFDYVNHKVRYEIRAKDGVDAYHVLVDGATLPNDKGELAAVGLRGGGSVSALNAVCKVTEPPPVDVTKDVTPPAENQDGEIQLGGNVEVALDVLTEGTYRLVNKQGKRGHLKWTDVSTDGGKFALVNAQGELVVTNGTPENGVSSSYDSYVLGLDPTQETARPAAIVKPGESQTAAGIPVYVPNLTNMKSDELGLKVYLQLQKKNGAGWENFGEKEPVSNTDHPALTVPMDGDVYRVNTVIE